MKRVWRAVIALTYLALVGWMGSRGLQHRSFAVFLLTLLGSTLITLTALVRLAEPAADVVHDQAETRSNV